MQDTKKPRTLNAADGWLLSHASALISYAAGDEQFAISLAAHIRERNWRCSDVDINEHTSIYLWPKDQTEAVRTAHWLLAELDRRPDAIYSRSVLAAYAAEFESPKDFILGMIGVAVSHSNLVPPHKKKKLRALLPIIIEENWLHTHSMSDLATLVAQLTHGITTNELKLAGGHTFRLHPTTASWCHEEPITKLYICNRATLKKIKTEIHTEELPSQQSAHALALSPTVDQEFLNQFSLVTQ